ncbi:hypothetical protein RFI_04490 [Reticulomyxa filosa]|uniref:Uncharacterized protein n=1 Tax=Reticulomyxa filosa TaxID=46433 RepID=X6P4W2_RETFI|nr:hypothetical protein RFI_04490 [Reticulomyxa filosa]|eukprot:ETO32627.1 hypothetical protein RFI_04490 [Reticulomyxa filosa]
MIAQEFGGFLSGIYLLRFFKYLWRKLRNLLYWITRQRQPVEEQLEELFSSSKKSATTPTVCFYAFALMWLLQWVWREMQSQQQLQQQQQQQQQQLQAQQQQLQAQQQQLQLTGSIPPFARPISMAPYSQYNAYVPSQLTNISQLQTQTQTQTLTQAQTQVQAAETVTNNASATIKGNTNTTTDANSCLGCHQKKKLFLNR